MPKPILLLGNVLVDVFSLKGDKGIRMRLGGIAHAARALWALDAEYHVAYFAPAYLHKQLEDYFGKHGATDVQCIGEVIGAPNTVLIGDVTEAGAQGYEVLLREEKSIQFHEQALRNLLSSNQYTDILMFPEISDPEAVIKILSDDATSSLHIDANNVPHLIESKGDGGNISIGSLFLSTSSSFFIPEFHGINELCDKTLSFCDELVLKENRGGTRVFIDGTENPLSVPCFPRDVVHSVGVGDGFDAAYLVLRRTQPREEALRRSSLVAASYASTTYVDDLRDDVKICLSMPPEDIMEMKGTILPWESRKALNIYVAAPDFDYVVKPELDHLVECLEYHNFNARLPVRENGQATDLSNPREKRRLYNNDIKIMNECSLLIAVLLYNDQGTLLEIGMAKEKGMPVIVYDPRGVIDNLFMEILPDYVTTTAESTIEATFKILGK